MATGIKGCSPSAGYVRCRRQKFKILIGGFAVGVDVRVWCHNGWDFAVKLAKRKRGIGEAVVENLAMDHLADEEVQCRQEGDRYALRYTTMRASQTPSEAMSIVPMLFRFHLGNNVSSFCHSSTSLSMVSMITGFSCVTAQDV